MEIKLLVRRAKKGDKDALVELIMAQRDAYYKLAYVYLKNKEDALDALEDMIVILYESIYKLKKEEAFYSWSKTILVNCCKKTIKERKNFVAIEAVEEKINTTDLDEKNNKLVLEKYLAELDESHREIIELRYLLDLEYQVIADFLKLPLGTVKSRIYYAINKLQQKFGGDRYE